MCICPAYNLDYWTAVQVMRAAGLLETGAIGPEGVDLATFEGAEFSRAERSRRLRKDAEAK